MKQKQYKKVLFGAGPVLGLLCITNPSFAQDRFSAPRINSLAREFEERFHETPRNISYVVARALSTANRAVEQEINSEDFDSDDDNEVITTQNDGNAISGSVVVSPGVSANEILIININEGNTTAIRR